MAHAAASETKMQRLQYSRLGHLCRKSMKLLGGMATGTEFSDTDDYHVLLAFKVNTVRRYSNAVSIEPCRSWS
jgi:hypothetical protein